MSSELLRQAADEVERLAGLAPPGRWTARGLLATRPEIVADDDGRTEHVAEARARSAPWILTMSPDVAPALAAWLREAADHPTPAAVELAAAVLRRPSDAQYERSSPSTDCAR